MLLEARKFHRCGGLELRAEILHQLNHLGMLSSYSICRCYVFMGPLMGRCMGFVEGQMKWGLLKTSIDFWRNDKPRAILHQHTLLVYILYQTVLGLRLKGIEFATCPKSFTSGRLGQVC